MRWIEEGHVEPCIDHWYQWRSMNNKIAVKMGLPKKLWLRVHVGPQFSVDRAGTHTQLMMNMYRPRIDPLEEYPRNRVE